MSDVNKKTILTVDDNPVSCRLIERVFEERYEVLKAYSGMEAIEVLRKKPVDLVLLDIDMPGMTGYDVMDILRLDAKTAGIPVIFLTGVTEKSEELKALKLGAVDYIQKPFYPDILMQKIENALLRRDNVKQLNDLVHDKIAEAELFRRKCYLDPLTALWNRNYIENQVNLYLEQTDACGYLFILDVDNFKIINDAYGHMRGDEVLVELGRVLKKAETKSVLTARLAGDEFLIFVQNCSDDSIAKLLAESISTEIQSINVAYDTNVSVSVGIAKIEEGDDHFMRLYSKADKAMYEVKRGGKSNYRMYHEFT